MAEIFLKGSESLAAIYKKISIDLQDESIRYRLATHVLLKEMEGQRLLVHLATGRAYLLNGDEWNCFMELAEEGLSGIGVSGEWIERNGLISFLRERIIVNTEFDDVNFYQEAVKVRRIMNRKNKGITTYTILPTTACNARCFYCYEKDFVPQTMDEKTAMQVAEYIKNTHASKVKLAWFGGEPLVGEKYISLICDELKKAEIPYTSSMISNGSLITEEIVRRMKEEWKLTRIQISLDGCKEQYERRKAYVNPEKYTYESVMQSVKLLLEAEINVVVRCNTDYDNLSEMEDFLKDISERFGKYRTFRISFRNLFQTQGDGEKYLDLMRELQRLNNLTESMHIGRFNKPGDDNDDADEDEDENKVDESVVNFFKVRNNYCMADNMDGAVLIMPDGSFNNCEHCPEGRCFGNVFEGITDEALYKQLKQTPAVMPECRTCCFLPLCTAYRKYGCPGYAPYCRENMEIDAEAVLRRGLNKRIK